MAARRVSILGVVLTGLVTGCGTPASQPAPDAGTPDAGTPVVHDVCATPTPLACEDQVIQTLNLQKTAAPGLIENTADQGGGWVSKINATAGGFNADPPTSFVYAKFGASGLEKVGIGDQEALASMDWDIALRRYVLRLNSADSGPSCVGAVRVPGTGTFDSVTAAPDGIPFRTDDDFTDACTLIDDGSGLPTSPGTALATFYDYKDCLRMTGHVYVVQLRSGKLLKATVQSYYEAGQDACNATGEPGSGSGHVTMHWAFLP